MVFEMAPHSYPCPPQTSSYATENIVKTKRLYRSYQT